MGWSRLRGACQQRKRHSKFLSYLTGVRYVHPWWRSKCQSYNQVPARHGKSRGIAGTYTRPPYSTWFTTTATKDRGGSRCYRPPDVATCVAGTWLRDWHLSRHQGWTSSTCKVGQKLGVSLPLLTYSPSAWPSRLLYHRGRNSQRNLWITLYYERSLMKSLIRNGVFSL
jgi:hypothetical protein